MSEGQTLWLLSFLGPMRVPKVYGWCEDGHFGQTLSFTFSSSESGRHGAVACDDLVDEVFEPIASR
jgi:hypothetical protein